LLLPPIETVVVRCRRPLDEPLCVVRPRESLGTPRKKALAKKGKLLQYSPFLGVDGRLRTVNEIEDDHHREEEDPRQKAKKPAARFLHFSRSNYS
jgi:hypothetical protein